MSTDFGQGGTSGRGAGGGGATKAPSSLRSLTVLVLVGMAAEFVFGTYVNVAVTLPSGGSSAQGSMPAMRAAMSNPAVLGHILLGIAVVLGGVVLMGLAAQSGNKSAAGFAALGVGGLGASAAAGMVFLMGGQAPMASFVMAMGFLLSFASYFALLLAIQRQ